MALDSNLKKLDRLLSLMDEDSLTKEDFVKAFDAVIEHIKKVENGLSDEVSKVTETLTSYAKDIKDTNADEFSALKEKVMSYCMSEMSKMMREHSEKMAQMDAKMDSVKDGEDADPEEIKQAVLDGLNIPTEEDIMNGLPRYGERIRDALELLPEGEKLKIDAIEGLTAILEELKRRPIGSVGGATMPVSHWPLHESFTMDGVATTVTLSQGVGAAGTALIVRYQGQTQDLTTHYTVSGNTITFVGFVPEADTIISVTYWP